MSGGPPCVYFPDEPAAPEPFLTLEKLAMKKSLIALAVLATAGVASAQSSVTLFGTVDATLQIGKGNGAGSADRTQLGASGLSSAKIGFRGVEDLGGGMSAGFHLEASALTDNGSSGLTSTNNQNGALAATTGGGGLTFGRRSTVSLAGNFGEIRLGRDYTPKFNNLGTFDPFGTYGVGTTQHLLSAAGIAGATQVRASNSLGYFLPGNLGGFYGQVMYFLGENAKNGLATEDDGNGWSGRIGYAAGPVNVGIAMLKQDQAAGDIRTYDIGGSYDFGVGKLMADYGRDRISGGVTGKGYLIGGLIPVGVGEIRLSYSTYKTDAAGTPKTNKYAIGYVHNLSKRTALYTTFATVRNSGFAAAAVSQSLNGAVVLGNNRSSGFDFGLRHNF